MNKKPPDPDTGLVESIRDGLPDGVELDEREEALLDLAARQPRDIGALEADISTRGYLVSGSRGQEVLNPSTAELRQSRLALGKLLGRAVFTGYCAGDVGGERRDPPTTTTCNRGLRRASAAGGEQPEPLAGQVERHMNARVHGMPARLSYA